MMSLHSPRQFRWLKKLKKLQGWLTSKPVYKVGQPKSRSIHLKFLHVRPRTHLRGSWISHFPRNPVAGMGRRTTLVRIVHTLLPDKRTLAISLYVQNKAGHWSQVCLQQLNTIKTVRRSIIPLYQQVKLWAL